MQLKLAFFVLLAPFITATPLAEPEAADGLTKRETVNCPGYGTCGGPEGSPYCCKPKAYGGCCNRYKRDLIGDTFEKRTIIQCPGYGSCGGPEGSPYCCKVTKWGGCCNRY